MSILVPAEYITEDERLYLELQDNLYRTDSGLKYNSICTEISHLKHLIIYFNYNNKNILVFDNQIVRKNMSCMLILADTEKRVAYYSLINGFGSLSEHYNAMIKEYGYDTAKFGRDF